MDVLFVNFYNKFISLCNEKGESPSAAAEKAGLSRSQVTRWKNGKGFTDISALKLADYFGVDVASLKDDESEILYFGYDDPDEWLIEEFNIVRNSQGIRDLIHASKGLSEDQLTLIAKLVSQIRR